MQGIFQLRSGDSVAATMPDAIAMGTALYSLLLAEHGYVAYVIKRPEGGLQAILVALQTQDIVLTGAPFRGYPSDVFHPEQGIDLLPGDTIQWVVQIAEPSNSFLRIKASARTLVMRTDTIVLH